MPSLRTRKQGGTPPAPPHFLSFFSLASSRANLVLALTPKSVTCLKSLTICCCSCITRAFRADFSLPCAWWNSCTSFLILRLSATTPGCLRSSLGLCAALASGLAALSPCSVACFLASLWSWATGALCSPMVLATLSASLTTLFFSAPLTFLSVVASAFAFSAFFAATAATCFLSALAVWSTCLMTESRWGERVLREICSLRSLSFELSTLSLASIASAS
mmetsp:Transcript_4407/g.10100  ORF Transcript_4407/g.10100 Transcript_4407/m.10100 type:complete len:220 (+) Transcript_4407:36-695(+)